MKKIYTLVILFTFSVSNIFAQIAIPNTTPVTESMDGMNATTTLVTNWRMGINTASPTWAGGTGTLSAQASSGAPTAGGTYNWGSSATERAAGVMTSGSFASPNSLMGFYQNTNASNITQLAVSYKCERYRQNTAAASVQFYYSLNGTAWTAVTAGDIAAATFVTGASTYGFPLNTYTVSAFNITGLSIANGANFYLRWNMNTTGASSQGIGIDDVSVTATFATCTTPTAAASAITFSSTTSTTTTVNWVSGNGSSRIVVAKLGSAPGGTPSNSTTYAANAAFGSGATLAAGEYVVYNGSGNTCPVTGLSATSTYYFTIFEYGCSAGSELYYTTGAPSNSVATPASIAAPTFSTPVCLSYGGATLLVSFTSAGTFTGNTYNVELSSAAGSFAAPINIGSIVSNSNTITNLSCTIPYGTAGGTGYLIRVTGSGPATTGASSAAFTISTNSISPLATQNNSPGVNGGSLTVTGYTASTISWKYGTVSGGPYGISLGAGTTQSTSLPFTGTYYMVCTNNYATCGLVTSAEVQLNVTLPAVTSPTVTNICIADETVNWTLPAGFSVTNNTILVFAKAGSAVTVGTPTNAIGTYTANTTFGSGTAFQNDASAFCVYKGTSNTVNVTGLTAGVAYHYLILNVQNSPTVYATGATVNASTLAAPSDVTGLTATTSNGEIDLNWTNPSCYDEILVLASNTGAISSVPTGNGSLYFDNPIYGDALANANLSANEFDVFQGTNPLTTISGLLNGQPYYLKVFVRKGTYWSSGVAINATPNFALNHFQSATSGNWNDYLTWNVWNGTAFVPATSGQFPNSNNYDVTILNGHTITYNVGGYAVRTLQVDAGGKLYCNQSQNVGLRYVAIYSSIVCNGTIGDGTNDDGISFRIEGATCTISGTGTFYCARIKKEIYPTTTTNLTISRNINLTWAATALLNDCSATSTFNVIISAGATVSTRSDKGNVSIDGTNGADSSPLRGTITVFGTLNVNGNLYLTTNNTTGNAVNFTIRAGGVVNADTVIAAASGAGTHNLLIYNNGLLNVYGSAGFYNFSSTNNTYTCNGGAVGATIEYSGSAQPVESGITYTNLKYSGSGNKTSNGNLTVNGNFIVDAAICEFNTSVKTLNLGGNLVLQNGGTMSDNCKTFLNITTNSATTAQIFTGNSQIIKCLNLTSVKTSGSLSLAGASGNTDLYIKNDLKIDHSGTAVLTDNGNTFNIGDDAEIGGASSTSTNFNLTGTLKFFCFYSSTDIHLSDYAGTGVTKARIGNLTLEPLTGSPFSTIQFYPVAGAQTVFINGNLNILNTNSTGTILNPNNNTISIKGNWTNYNATGFTEGSGRVIFSGATSSQTIAASEIFNELEINNSNGVTLNFYNFVSSELILTNGKLNTGANQISILSNAVGSISGYSTSSWVNGNLNRTVASTGSYDFPVGDATNYQLATVNINSSTGMSSIIAFFNTTITGTPPSYPTTKINGEGIYGLLNSGFWTITPNAYTTVNYDITLNQRGYSNFSGNANQLGVIKRVDASTDWLGTNLANSNGHHDNATQSIPFGAGVLAIAKRSGVTAFSDFAVGYGAVPLPVTLSAFNLNVKNNKLVELNWKTEAELNCDFYSVERSEDGIVFTSIGKVSGHQTSDQPHNYQLTDYNPICNESYYKLRQVDLDGEEHFSNMLSAIISCDGILISPNLVLDNLFLKFLNPNQGSTKIIISNIEGKLFVEKTIYTAQSIVDLNVSSLPAGLYFIQITNGSINYNSRFMKQ